MTSLLAALCSGSIFHRFLPPALKEATTAQIAECSELDFGDVPDWQPNQQPNLALVGVPSHGRGAIFPKEELSRRRLICDPVVNSMARMLRSVHHSEDCTEALAVQLGSQGRDTSEIDTLRFRKLIADCAVARLVTNDNLLEQDTRAFVTRKRSTGQ